MWKAGGAPEPWWKWYDSLTRFEGPVVTSIDQHFRQRWLLDGGKPFDLASPAIGSRAVYAPRGFPLCAATVYVNEPNNHPNAIRELYVHLIEQVERSIFIEKPYFYHPALVDALVRAKQKQPTLSVTLVCRRGPGTTTRSRTMRSNTTTRAISRAASRCTNISAIAII